jgi:beta-lactamase regulating signal transducer with metallopeptidase domain
MKKRLTEKNIDSTSDRNVWIGVGISSLVLLALVASVSGKNNVQQVPVTSRNISSVDINQAATTTNTSMVQNNASSTIATTTSAATTTITTTSSLPQSVIASVLEKQMMKLQAKEEAEKKAADAAKIQELLAKKQKEQKSYSGQEAINFIKTLPLETQRQILGKGK